MFGEMLIKGLIIGVSIAAPVGPIGILCIRRTIEHGRFVGFVSGLGAATADALYGLIAGFGLAIITNFLIEQQFWLQLIGSTFLCYLGVKIFFSRPSNKSAKAKGNKPFTAYASTFFLTITNPVTILSFIAIFSGLGITNNYTTTLSLILVLGVFLGSALWWLLLSNIAGIVTNRMKSFSLSFVNRISGLILLLFGLYGFMVWVG
ncbi:LysE family transporter [Cytobacillus sp. Sa5YUA1]|uniref:LysE family transporter n=1 Tax=Cytobacillus stercorigallinarum TaxID=2762240 RepID=A0ABR8QR81_9BACI|nr:LysE family transporter [Cytobacillus stercorigallinarum]MBD7938003.1 LysE family transporter [Cytobacillus stercorigallinarum]